MKMKARTQFLGSVAVAIVLASAAAAQHDGDIAVGRNSAGQLMVKPFDPNSTPCFDPAAGVALLQYFASSNSWRSTNPGFDANFPADPELNFYPLEVGAVIYLEAVADLEPAFYVEYQGVQVVGAGDDMPLGSSALHRHLRFIVDGNNAGFDPLKTLWRGTFILRDDGSTGYADSAPFTLRVAIVDCTPGDVNGDENVDFGDIDPFVAVLSNVAGATDVERCAADANLDGVVDFGDIDAFVRLLSQ